MPNAARRITSSEEQNCDSMLAGQACHWSGNVSRYEWRADRLLASRENTLSTFKEKRMRLKALLFE